MRSGILNGKHLALVATRKPRVLAAQRIVLIVVLTEVTINKARRTSSNLPL